MCGLRRLIPGVLFTGALLCGLTGCGDSEDNLPPEEHAKAILQEARENEPGYAQGIKIAKELASLGEPAAPVLINALNDEVWRVRQISVEALGRMGAEEATEPLAQRLLEEPDERVRSVMPRALGNIGAPGAIDALIETMKDDPDEGVRQQAAIALGEFSDQKVVDALLGVLETNDDAVMVEAMSSLSSIGDPAAVEPIIEKVSAGGKTRLGAIEALGILGDERAYDTLVQSLQSGNPYVKSAAVTALGNLGDPRAVEHLAKLAQDPEASSNIRMSALRALKKLGTDEAKEAIRACEQDENDHLRRAAREALADDQ
ncbi:MAG: HEAT repeat domain-containing protein [Planctomycetota bacterium]